MRSIGGAPSLVASRLESPVKLPVVMTRIDRPLWEKLSSGGISAIEGERSTELWVDRIADVFDRVVRRAPLPLTASPSHRA